MIFYFSGTGNTRWAAQQIAEATGERLLSIPDELNSPCTYQLAEAERIGFCFPVHGWQPPHIVRQFVSRLNLTPHPSSPSPAVLPPTASTVPGAFAAGVSTNYTFVLCTCGDSVGQAMDMFRRQLSEKNITLDSCQSLIMPESYVCLPFMYTDTPERERLKISQARKDLDRFIDIVQKCKKGYSSITAGLSPWIYSHVIGAYFNSNMVNDRKFTVDSDRCLHCGRCMKECPVGNIVATGDKLPAWKHEGSCTACLSCYHHCPVHAINYGKITRSRGQYYFGHNG